MNPMKKGLRLAGLTLLVTGSVDPFREKRRRVSTEPGAVHRA